MAQVTSQAHDLQDRCLLRWRHFHALRLELRHGHGVRADGPRVGPLVSGVFGVHVGDVQLEAAEGNDFQTFMIVAAEAPDFITNR